MGRGVTIYIHIDIDIYIYISIYLHELCTFYVIVYSRAVYAAWLREHHFLLQAQQRLIRLPQPPARVQSLPDARLRHGLHVGAPRRAI